MAKTRTAATKKAGDQVDEQLARYRSMRDFAVTAEPNGKKRKASSKKAAALPFVIQKHAATRLHYDFRLGWNGVLKSWAVAKGPSYFTGDRRLAVQVEDHPMEYGGFEGIIPKGQYGGGSVMVWDQGTWEPQAGHTDVDEGLAKGSLKFTMHGTKMKGNWTLVRMHTISGDKPNWLLIKEHDEFETTKDAKGITEEKPNSVVTGRSLDQIAKAETHVWQSNKTRNPGQAWFRKDEPLPTKTSRKKSVKLDGLPSESLPAFIEPQLATNADKLPAKGDWVHELKLDGYRIQARKQGEKVHLLTRTGLDWTHRMRPVADAVGKLPAEDALLDGEVVVLDENGLSSFAKLQASFESGELHPYTYFIFDLLHLNGHNTRPQPLLKRKNLLQQTLPASEVLRLSEHLTGDAEAIFHQACGLHAEGIVSKRADAPYTSGRSSSWLKSKCVHEQEFVIGGFTLPSNGTYGVGSLLLGTYTDGKLIYCGRTGTGFTQKTHRMLRDRLEALQQSEAPFVTLPLDAKHGAHWVRPELVAQVRFATWTSNHRVRHASYLGLREDKAAADVVLEEAAPKPRSLRPKANIRSVAAPALRLTHPDKILDETTRLTKLQLAEYYWAVADRMLPHIADRPLSLVRCPEGSGKPCFFQKHTNHLLPPGVGSVMVPDKKTGKPESYLTLNTAEALAGLAQMGVLEVHPWSSTNADLEHPDRIIFDLDPDEAISWKRLAASAIEVRDALKTLGLKSFVKTTGGKGLHVVLPIVPTADWNAIRNWTHTVAQVFEKEKPELYLTKMTKAARKGKIFIDYLRNERGATAVAAFSPRAREGAPVSIPLLWDELMADTHPQFRVTNLTEWKGRLAADPWKTFFTLKQKLPSLA